MKPNRPPYDPSIEQAIKQVASASPLSVKPDMIHEFRSLPSDSLADILREQPLRHSEFIIPGYANAEICVSVLSRTDHRQPGPGILFLHGGGMISGNRFSGLAMTVPWILEHDAVVVSAEYRLAPEFEDPHPVEDCFAAFKWMVSNVKDLVINPERILVAGASAGGGLASGVCLLARDRGGIQPCGQLLIYPMLDEKNNTVSSLQFAGIGLWDRESNETGWNALLGTRRGTDEVSYYASPSRADNLSGLPPAFIDVASAEVFRDECVSFAMRMWADGGIAELHVWPGGTHAFDIIAPEATISKGARTARDSWIRRVFAQ